MSIIFDVCTLLQMGMLAPEDHFAPQYGRVQAVCTSGGKRWFVAPSVDATSLAHGG